MTTYRPGLLGSTRLAAGALALAALTPAHAAIFFSEYIEGSSNNKALEIFNAGASAVALDGHEVRLFANGSATATGKVSLAGVLAAGETLVLAHPSASPAVVAAADLTSAALNFNGDDAIGLFAGDALLDGLGQVGLDPGDAWVSAQTSTRDQTLRRDPTVILGVTDLSQPFDPGLGWIPYPLDTFEGLGSHAVSAATVPVPASLPLLGAALGALSLLARRRRTTALPQAAAAA
jgi:hypothetical protein